MSYASYRALTEEEIQACRDNGIDPIGKSVVLSGPGYLLLLHHKTGDNIRINYGLARLRSMKGEKNDHQ